MTTTVPVVDDQPLFCSGMELLITAQTDLAFAGAAHSGDDAVVFCRRSRPDVVLMDLRMPDGNGITATRTISRLRGAPRVLILTTFRDRRSTELALEAGATGFITKDATPGELVAAIRDTAAGIQARTRASDTSMLSDQRHVGPPTSRRKRSSLRESGRSSCTLLGGLAIPTSPH